MASFRTFFFFAQLRLCCDGDTVWHFAVGPPAGLWFAPPPPEGGGAPGLWAGVVPGGSVGFVTGCGPEKGARVGIWEGPP